MKSLHFIRRMWFNCMQNSCSFPLFPVFFFFFWECRKIEWNILCDRGIIIYCACILSFHFRLYPSCEHKFFYLHLSPTTGSTISDRKPAWKIPPGCQHFILWFAKQQTFLPYVLMTIVVQLSSLSIQAIRTFWTKCLILLLLPKI